MRERTLKAPYVPELKGDLDLRYFTVRARRRWRGRIVSAAAASVARKIAGRLRTCRASHKEAMCTCLLAV